MGSDGGFLFHRAEINETVRGNGLKDGTRNDIGTEIIGNARGTRGGKRKGLSGSQKRVSKARTNGVETG